MGNTAKDSAAAVHLSIGEVLALLQDEFPDVTISKIRFLESQGLIAPERTASGYRKFYDSDIERLRWILTQQRDHFLPLKVIKRMLDQGADTAGGGEQTQLFAEPAGEPGPASGAQSSDGDEGAGRHRSMAHPAVAAAHSARGGDTAGQDHQPGADSSHADQAVAGHDSATDASAPSQDESAGPAGEASRSSGTPPHADGAVTEGTAADAGGSSGRPNKRSDATRVDESRSGTPGSGAAPAATTAGDERSDTRERTAERRLATPADVVAALQESPRPGRRGREEVPAMTEHAGRSGSLGQPAQGEKLTADELCAAAGIDTDLLADLEQYGLVVPASLGGRPTYDGDALVVARIAARCSSLGIEPRHLRIYKIAAEREAGLLEQSVMPLLKQRNPVARDQAVERADEVLAMGAELHATLLRRNLGPILGL